MFKNKILYFSDFHTNTKKALINVLKEYIGKVGLELATKMIFQLK
jgi:hypothetical protein